jgi:hypothetical protein
MPTDPGPYLTQASVYRGAAVDALESEASDRAGAVLDDLALVVASYDKAIALEPADWTLHFSAAVATVDLLLATGYAEDWLFTFAYDELDVSLTGLGDWSGLADTWAEIPGPGSASASLALDEETRSAADRYRGEGKEDLIARAQSFLEAAKQRNPLAGQIDAVMQKLEMIGG